MATNRKETALRSACDLILNTPTDTSVSRSYKGGFRTLARTIDVGRKINSQQIVFDATDIAIIRNWVEKQGVDPWQGPAESQQSRIETAAWQSDEKTGSASLSAYYNLVALSSFGFDPLYCDSEPIKTPEGGFQVIPGNRTGFSAIDWMLSIENLDAFLYLLSNPQCFRQWQSGRGMIVLRSAPAFPGGVQWIQTMQQHLSFEYRHAPDMDIAGLGHCLELLPEKVWLPSIDDLRIQPHHKLFENQCHSLPSVKKRAQSIAPNLLPYINWIDTHGGGITQEQMLAHDAPMQMVTIT